MLGQPKELTGCPWGFWATFGFGIAIFVVYFLTTFLTGIIFFVIRVASEPNISLLNPLDIHIYNRYIVWRSAV